MIGPTPSAASPSEQPASVSKEPSSSSEEERWALDAIEAMRKAMRKTRSVECVFYKEEWKDGVDLTPAQARLKHRRGGATFLAFESGPEAGRHILWRPKHNNGN